MAQRKSAMTPQELRDKLEELALSQQQAARVLGVDPRTMRRWVLGEVPIPQMVANFFFFLTVEKLESWMHRYVYVDEDA